MRILRDAADVAVLEDEELRALIERRLDEREIGEDFDSELHGPFVVMVPGDGLVEVEAAVGIPLLVNPVTRVAYGDPAFSPIFEYAGRHARFYELVFIPGGGDEGVTLFVPRHPDVEPRLLALCAEYAVTEPVAV